MVSKVALLKYFSQSDLRTFKRPGLAAIAGIALAAGSCGGSETKGQVSGADIVFVGGDLHTMNPDAPRATGLALRGDTIIAVGGDELVKRYIGGNTRVVNLAGRSMSPGLTDAHCHLYGLGKSLEQVNLRGVASPEAAAQKALLASEKLGDGEWVAGRGWDQNIWLDKKYPHRSVLDAVFPKRPVALRRVDGHAVWVNSLVLEMVGIDDATPDPEGGKILRDEEGHATGVLIDVAMNRVQAKLGQPSIAAIRRRILKAAKIATSLGLTTVHDMGISSDVAGVYRALADEGRLPLRVYGMISGDSKIAMELGKRVPEQDRDGREYFVLRGIKLYADGALGSRGAALLEEYSDEPGNRGNWISSGDQLKAAAISVAEAGWQLSVHAIGDAANRAVLDAYEAAGQKFPDRDLRFRVEHAQVLSEEDIPRFAALNVIASMQPTHATSDMPWAEARVGNARIAGAYAWRKILNSGAHLVAGSDFPVEKVSPLLGLYSAVTRQDAKGMPAGGWLPSERLSLDEAIAAFTKAAAYASFVEEHRGVLRVGYVADLTIFDRPLVADSSLLSTEIDMTLVGGEVRFEGE